MNNDRVAQTAAGVNVNMHFIWMVNNSVNIVWSKLKKGIVSMDLMFIWADLCPPQSCLVCERLKRSEFRLRVKEVKQAQM